MFVPYPYRPFWQPNSRSAVHHSEGLTQKLDAAEKKIDEYSRLIASLCAELKRYQDIICYACTENVTRANLAARTGSIQTASISSAPSLALTIPSAQAETEPSLSSDSSLGAHDGKSPEPPLHLPNSSEPISRPDADIPQVTLTLISPDSSDPNLESSQPALPSSESKSTTNTGPNSLWSVEYNPKRKRSLSLHVANTLTFANWVLCTKFSRDGRYLAVGLENGEVHVHDMTTGSTRILAERPATVFYTDNTPTRSDIWSVRFNKDNRFIATGGSNGKINIWEIGRRRLRASFTHKGLVRCVDLSPNNHFLASASNDKSVCLWRIRDGSRRTLYQHEHFVFMSVAFSRDGQYVAAENDDGYIRIWDTRSGLLVTKFRIGERTANLGAMTFAPDGQRIAIGGHTVQFWDLGFLKEIRSRRLIDTGSTVEHIFESEQRMDITAVSFSSDNRWVLSSSRDHTVSILDAQSGAWVCTLKAHTSGILGADFSPSGRYLVSGGQDHRVRLWKYEIVEES